MVLLAAAFSLQDQVEKYGAYIGLASFFGLAVLSLLYFAQAREVRRLREWAGRAPERLLDFEAHFAAQRPVARAAPLIRHVAEPEPAEVAPAGNGTVVHKLKPEQVAALAFARAAGVAFPPHPPKPSVPVVANGAGAVGAPVEPVPVPVAVAAPEAVPVPAPTPAQAAAPPPSPAQAAAPPPELPPPPVPNGRSAGDPPAPSTPAARRPELRNTAAPLRATPPARRPVAPSPRQHTVPPRHRGSTRTVVFSVLFGVLVLAAVGFGASQLLGGGEDPVTPSAAKKPAKEANTIATTGPDEEEPGATATPAPTRDTIKVMVLNGTREGGLAANIGDKLVTAGFTRDNVYPGNNTPNQQILASVVMYKRGQKALALDVAKALSIKTPVKLVDAGSQELATLASKDPDVFVIVGADKTGL